MSKGIIEQEDELGTAVPSLTAELGTRIDAIAPTVGGVEELAKSAGLSPSQLYRIIAGSQTKIETVARIARAARVNLHWLATGDGQRYLDEEAREWSVREPGADYAYLPLYDVSAAAGHGSLIEHEEIVNSLAFKKEWIHNELHANPSDLYLIYVQGDSMEPALRAGDVILVNRNCAHAQHDGVFVLVLDGTLLVKRLQSLPGGRVRVSSDNPAYQPFELQKSSLYPENQPEGDGPGIIGRVVWAGRRM